MSAEPERPGGRAQGLSTAVAGLWQKFRDSVLQRVETLEEATVALLTGALAPELRRRAEREAHKLAGSVGTFGFAEGSRLARTIELLLQGEAPLGPTDALRLSEWVNALREELEGDPQPQQQPAQAQAEPGAPEITRPLLVLVTPDRELAERVAMEAEGRGFAVRWFAWEEEAEAALRSARVAALVVDLGQGPAFGAGLRLLTGIARRENAPAVVVLAERDSFADRVEATRLGADTYLKKPLPPARVVDAVARGMTHGEVSGARVMAVDDDETILASLERLLGSRGISLVPVGDPLRFWETLEGARPDLVVLDQDMPGLRGVDLCRALRSDPRWSRLPVLFLTGTTDPGIVHSIFAAGADDIVRKPFVGPELLSRVAGRLERTRLQATVEESVGPGGLPARRFAAAQITRLLQIAGRQGEPVAVGRIEVDGLASLREQFGSVAVGEILRRIAGLLQLHLPEGDVTGWWSGEGFMVGMYGADQEIGAQRLLEVLDVVRAEPIPGARQGHVTFSAGVAGFPRDGGDLAQLCDAAEEALRTAVEAGGGRVLGAGQSPQGRRTEVVDVALVEDDPVLAELLLHALETQGYRARWIDDGEVALQQLGGAAPALRARVILLDVDLPARDGLSVLRALARDDINESSHIIMLTVRSTEREVLEALELGAADHVAKPFSIPVLLQRIRSALRRG